MDRVLHGSILHQVVGGSHSWWNMENLRPSLQETYSLLPSSSSLSSSSSSSSSSTPSLPFPLYPQTSSFFPITSWLDSQQPPETWSQLLLGGYFREADRCGFASYQAKRMENWENEALTYISTSGNAVDVKQEHIDSAYPYVNGNGDIDRCRLRWSQILSSPSPQSCVTSFSSNMLDFSNSTANRMHHKRDDSSECNSTASGSALKKARVQPSSIHSTFKVRKEKLGDRIAALHQLVSPFGKTDTASVLLEAIGYIRFLHSQIEALVTPYLGNGPTNKMRHLAKGERNCIFPEDPGQLLNDPYMNGANHQCTHDEPKDLKSRGLCAVPVSLTSHVGNENGADYWAPMFR